MTDQQFNQRAIANLNVKLRQYLTLSRRATEEVISQKGNDMRIQMFRGLRARAWKGGKTSAWDQMKARSESKLGTVVRTGIDFSKSPTHSPITGRKLTTQARKVYAEVAKRAAGVGVLGASFLLKRWDRKARKLRMNTTGRGGGSKLAEFTFDSSPFSDKSEYVAAGFRPGIDVVSNRYGVANSAMGKVSADMEAYIQRKQNEALARAFLK